jgi:hypothetical protein
LDYRNEPVPPATEFDMKTIHPVVILFSVLGPVLHTSVAGESPKSVRVFRGGAATSNITPHLGAPLNGQMYVRKAAHIHDELHARCLALDDGTTKFVLVVCDSCMIPREVFDEARRQVQEATGLPPKYMLMSATHTHSAPAATPGFDSLPDPDYLTFLSRRIADGVRRALNNLEPARIGWSVGRESKHVANRRWWVSDPGLLTNPFGGMDKVRTNPQFESPALIRPAGPVDPEVSVISVMALDGRPIAVFASYSLHYVSGAPADHVSAGYFATFAESRPVRRPRRGVHAEGRLSQLPRAELLGAGSTAVSCGEQRSLRGARGTPRTRRWRRTAFRREFGANAPYSAIRPECRSQRSGRICRSIGTQARTRHRRG